MELTCRQVETLLSFYIDGDLNYKLRRQIENHLLNCESCTLKYETLKKLLGEFENSYRELDKVVASSVSIVNDQYKTFRDNLSAYVDNELTDEENIKLKKYTISKPFARKELQSIYTLRKLMADNFEKTKNEMKHDYSKSVMSELNISDEIYKMDPFFKITILLTLLAVTCLSIITVLVWI